jgi:hypothetical protein
MAVGFFNQRIEFSREGAVQPRKCCCFHKTEYLSV